MRVNMMLLDEELRHGTEHDEFGRGRLHVCKQTLQFCEGSLAELEEKPDEPGWHATCFHKGQTSLGLVKT